VFRVKCSNALTISLLQKDKKRAIRGSSLENVSNTFAIYSLL